MFVNSTPVLFCKQLLSFLYDFFLMSLNLRTVPEVLFNTYTLTDNLLGLFVSQIIKLSLWEYCGVFLQPVFHSCFIKSHLSVSETLSTSYGM